MSDIVVASWYALTTHTEAAGSMRSSRAMVGSATLAIEPSSTAMIVPMAIAVTAKRRSRGAQGRVCLDQIVINSRVEDCAQKREVAVSLIAGHRDP